jgi:hypothetical protein
VEGPRIVLRDLGSTNGTFVDAVRVRDADIPAGTVVRVGDSTFRVEAKGTQGILALSEKTELGELVGASVAMRAVYAVLERAARTDTTVLVVGETGTGKDVAARSLHALSPRAKGPLRARSTAARSRRTSSRASSSATRVAPSPVRTRTVRGASPRQRAARCFSMKSASCRCRSR